jgi:phosphatidylglycerophosphatase A
MNTLIKVLASGLGSGYSPVASGTAGSALAALIAWFLFPDWGGMAALIVCVVLVISVPVSTAAERLYGKKDDGHIVIDEFIGMWISTLWLPRTPGIMIAAFFLFRVMDVIKPFFVRKVQVWPGGWGIVADDFFAGIITNLILQAAVYALGL